MGASIWWRRRRSHPRRRDFQSLALLPELLRHFCSLHQLQQAAITKPSSNCQRSIYPENSNGYLDFSSKTATSSFICCGICPLSTQSNCQQFPFINYHTRQSRSCCKCVLIMLYILPCLGISVNRLPILSLKEHFSSIEISLDVSFLSKEIFECI